MARDEVAAKRAQRESARRIAATSRADGIDAGTWRRAALTDPSVGKFMRRVADAIDELDQEDQ